MADWIICPACGLKHDARADGACPRCRTRVARGDASWAAPGSAPPATMLQPSPWASAMGTPVAPSSGAPPPSGGPRRAGSRALGASGAGVAPALRGRARDAPRAVQWTIAGVVVGFCALALVIFLLFS